MMTKDVVKENGPYIFRTYDHWPANPEVIDPLERNPGTAHTIPIADVARATSAAPFYFDNVIIQNRKFGDGGFGTNNPSIALFNEVVQMSNGDPKVIKAFVSIGTGLCEISRFSDKAGLSEVMTWFNAAKKLATDSEDAHSNMLTLAKAAHIPYNRFNVGMTHMAEVDGASNSSQKSGMPAAEPSAEKESCCKKCDARRRGEESLGNMKLDEWKKRGGIKARKECEITLEKIRCMTEE
jgi:hypothetical protein